MRIAIFGSSGFIGHNLYAKAVLLGHEVMRIDHDLGNGENTFFCDLASGADIELPGNMDAVFYLAQSPHYHQFPERAHDLFAVNSMAPALAAKAAVVSGCKFFCFASSGNVYAPSFFPLSEISPVAPSSPYAASKLMGETGLSCFKKDMRVVCCRIFGAYGPGQKAMLPWILLRKVMEGRPVLLEPRGAINDGGLRISFIYIDDLVDRLLDLMEQDTAGREIPFYLNLGGPKPVSLKEFAEIVSQKAVQPALFETGKKAREFDLWADITMLDSLCPSAFTSLEEGIGRMVEAAQEERS